ncbi:MAG: membrane protein insertion efficiency factor YidD [Lentisphaeria bacterium]|nr:membrane protein insertion efficiency factor YidD [Victivallales bacterium]MCR4575597.1 membrane protein insertion efficiency factor YidD [Lentisphaeria bacterium]
MKPLEWPRQAACAAIRFYQVVLSPLKGPCCRFTPTCSEYGRLAIERFGLLKGGWLLFWRLLKCHPFYSGNSYDPVPERKE